MIVWWLHKDLTQHLVWKVLVDKLLDSGAKLQEFSIILTYFSVNLCKCHGKKSNFKHEKCNNVMA